MNLENFREVYRKTIIESSEDSDLREYIRSIVEEVLEESTTYALSKSKPKSRKTIPNEDGDDFDLVTTEYIIKNNKTGDEIGTAKITRGHPYEDEYLTIVIDGNERSIKVSSKQTPEQAFNSWINNPKTSSKYKK